MKSNLKEDKTKIEIRLEVEHHRMQIRSLRKIMEAHQIAVNNLHDYAKGLEGLENLKMIGIRVVEEDSKN